MRKGRPEAELGSRPLVIGLWIGLGGGTLFGALAVAIALSARQRNEPGPAPTAEPRSDATAEPAGPSPAPVPRRHDTGWGIEDLVAAHIAGSRFDEAWQEIAAHENGLSPEERARARPLLDRLSRRYHEARYPGELGPEERRRLMVRHHEARLDNRIEEALAFLTLVIESDPKPVPDLYIDRAELENNLGRREAALADLDRAEALDSHGGTGSCTESISEVRCHVLVHLFRFDEARQCALRYIETGGSRHQGHCLLAQVLCAEGRLEEARVELESARSIRPDLLVLTDLALVYLGLGHRDVALGLLAQAERGHASDAVERNMAIAGQAWAWLHPSAGEPDYERARDHMLRLEKSPEKMPLEACTRGAYASITGQHEPAVRLFGFSSRHWTNYPEFGFYYARSLRALGRIEEADRILAVATRLRPELAKKFESSR